MGFGYSYFDIGIYLVFGAWVLEFHIRHADRSGGPEDCRIENSDLRYEI